MTKYTKQQALSIIVDCALKYEQNLSGRNLLFLLRSKELSVSSLEVAFYPYNFLHLTGVRVLHLFLVFLLKSPVFFKVSPAYLEELLSFLVSP